LLGHSQEMRAVRRGNDGGLLLAGIGQPLGSEQPDGLSSSL
jgi:hypothetical protein